MNGVSNNADVVFVWGPNIPKIFAWGGERPSLKMDKVRRHNHIRLHDPQEWKGWSMMGGNFAYSSDSRFPDYPVPIHDRYEGRDKVKNMNAERSRPKPQGVARRWPLRDGIEVTYSNEA